MFRKPSRTAMNPFLHSERISGKLSFNYLTFHRLKSQVTIQYFLFLFSTSADSHLVALQRDEDDPGRNPMNQSDYETQAINIANKARKGLRFLSFFLNDESSISKINLQSPVRVSSFLTEL